MFNNFNLSDEEILFLFEKYKPLILKASSINFKYDEDLNQEIKEYLFRVLTKGRKIKKFKKFFKNAYTLKKNMYSYVQI